MLVHVSFNDFVYKKKIEKTSLFFLSVAVDEDFSTCNGSKVMEVRDDRSLIASEMF